MELFERIKRGEELAVQQGLFHTAALYRSNALISAARKKISNPTITKAAKDLTEDSACLFGHNCGPTVADFARAYLHLLGIQRYTGDRPETNQLIEAKMIF